MGGGLRGGGGVPCSLGVSLSPSSLPDREGEEGRKEEHCLTQCTASSIREAKRRMSAICAHAPSKQKIPPGRLAFAVVCRPTMHAAGGKTGFTCTKILGSGATPLSNAPRQVSLVSPPMAPRGGGKSVCLAAIPVSDCAGRACSLQAQSIYAYYIHICTVYSNAERYPVLENRPRICAGGTGSGEISNRNTSPKYQPVPWLQ